MADDSKLSFPRLNEHNYNSWMGDILVKGEDTLPPADKPVERKAWRRDRDIAAGQIYLALEPSQRVHIRGMEEDPIKMWEKLAEVHVQKRPGVRFNAYDVLFNIRKKEDESLVSLMGRVDTAIQDIKALRTKDFKLEDADDELTCMAMIRALPADYSSFVSSLLLLEKLDKAKLQDAFIAEESNPCGGWEAGSPLRV
ncbi:hypothetical protein BD410DRAFT_812260 [Rickenella mellea]|uniref:Uncharacterized protein n=1 Tax=Rickenella mellea TaxID=50990 RepID=A0A4Y7QK15_9AGAM|nr:hypothetical protein BD410DRAFT_812260 [Rickenella mellea]